MLIVTISPLAFFTGALALIGVGVYIGYTARTAQVREAER